MTRQAMRLTKYIHVEATAFDDVLERANRDWFAAVIGDYHLPPVRMSPFLMTAALAGESESVLLEDFRDFSRAADRKSPAHGSASSSTLAPCGNGTSAGSNHSANASFAFATASSSVSPALAHPGSSGKTADQRCTSGSNSMTRRSFTRLKDTESDRIRTLKSVEVCLEGGPPCRPNLRVVSAARSRMLSERRLPIARSPDH